MKKKVLILAITALTAAAAGARTLTLDDAVELAVAGNLGLRQSGIELEGKKRSRETAWNSFLPSISASAGFNGTAGLFQFQGSTPPSLSDPGSMSFTAGVNFALPLNTGAVTGIQTLIAEYEAGQLTYEAARKELERDVRKQFFYLIAYQENIEIQEGNIELARKRLEQAESNFRNGLAPQLEVLSAEVTVANLLPAYHGVLDGYESLMLYFKFLLGTDRGEDITLEGSLDTELYELEAEELIRSYLPSRLDLRGLDKQIEALGYAQQALRQNFNTPTLNLGYSYGLSATNSDTSFSGGTPKAVDPWSDMSDRGTLSMTLQWKLDGMISGSSTDVQLSQMQDSIDSLHIARQMAQENAEIEITNLVNTLKTARQTIEAAASGVELAQRSYDLTEEAYRVGTRELLDVESAQNDYLDAVQQELLARYEYIAALLDLEYALNTNEFMNSRPGAAE